MQFETKAGDLVKARRLFCAVVVLVATLVLRGLIVARPDPQQVQASRNRAQPVVTQRPIAAPAAESPATASAPVPWQQSPWTAKGLLILVGAIALSALAAALRVVQKFRSFLGLGVFRNWYCWSFVGLVGLLSGFAYVGFQELESLLVKALNTLDPGFMNATKMAGAGGVGHALVALGRLARPRAHPVPPGEVSPCRDVASTNLVLDFFYTGIRNHLTEKMNLRAESLAREFDSKTIREVTCRLLEDQIAVGGPESAERVKVVEKIRAIPAASDPEQDFDNRYTALVLTIAKASYSQLHSRLSRKRSGAMQ